MWISSSLHSALTAQARSPSCMDTPYCANTLSPLALEELIVDKSTQKNGPSFVHRVEQCWEGIAVLRVCKAPNKYICRDSAYLNNLVKVHIRKSRGPHCVVIHR